jgi:hypothetical protein
VKTGAKPTSSSFYFVGRETTLSQPVVFDRRADADKAIWEKLCEILEPAVGIVTPFSKNTTDDVVSPSSGMALRVWGFFLYNSADIQVELRFKDTMNIIGALPTKGAAGMNLIGLKKLQGQQNEKISVYLSGAGTAKGWVITTEV